MAEILSLSARRKAQDRAAKRAEADANALKFGRSKAERHLEAAKADKAKRNLDAAKRE